MVPLSVRDRMIDVEQRHKAMAQDWRRSQGGPVVRETVQDCGRLLVRVGEALVAEGHLLEAYPLLQPHPDLPEGQAG